jgi:hypothetical protein
MSTRIAEQVLVTKGNYPVFPAGQAVWGAPTPNSKTPTLNVLPGQIVIYDPSTNLSLGPSATVENAPRIIIGVGVSRTGRGNADFLLTAAGQTIDGCAIKEINVTAPKCGQPEVKDLLFSCVDSNEPYTITVSAWDTDIRGQFDYNRPAEYVFTRSVHAASCQDCTSGDFSRQLACEFVDAINGKIPTGWDVTKNGKFITPTALPFTASRLYNNSLVFCLSTVENDACSNCHLINRLHSFTYDGAEAPVVFTNSNLPGNVEVTAIGQLEGIVEQINAVLGGNGTATLIASGANCCPYSIEINTCLSDFVLNGWDNEEEEPVALEPCGETTNPLEQPANAPTCTNCEESEDGTLTFPAGIRIFSKPVDPGAGCYIPPVRTYLARQIEVYPRAGFKPGTFAIVEVQDAENASNLGSQLIHLEYRENKGGPGRHLDRPYNSIAGRFNLPIAGDRITSLQTDPNEQYCHFVIEHGLPNSTVSYHGDKYAAKLRTRIFIPSSDNVTLTDFSTILNAYGTTIPCKKPVSLSCAG